MGNLRRRWTSRGLAAATAALVLAGSAPAARAANHREAPITALDHKADITDVYAFRSYSGDQSLPRVTMILDVDPLLEPGNGPTYFPFDEEILYAIRIDNDRDAEEDVVFEVRFKTEIRNQSGLLRGLWQSYIGVGAGVNAPDNSPKPVAPGTPIIPARVSSFEDAGLALRQTYTVTMVRGTRKVDRFELKQAGGGPLFAVPSNAGPRTMDYRALFDAGTYTVGPKGGGACDGIKVWAGTADDPFWIDLGGAFDSLNTSFGPVLNPAQDAAKQNFASDFVSGYNVNAIAIDVPIQCLTRTGNIEAASSPDAVIGVWGTTDRPRIKTFGPKPGDEPKLTKQLTQIQRMGNALINELLIGTPDKDRFSMSEPKDDKQFASYLLDPLLARVLNAATGGVLAVPDAPRLDLLPLVQYRPPICPACTTADLQGPVADLLRLNTGVPATPVSSTGNSRLGLLGGDPAGYPNGRRLPDDVTDISLRVVAGVLNPAFNVFPNNALGDGVNVNDAPYRAVFPYLADAWAGRNRRHIDPGEPGCTADAGPACAE
jgi:hypothetical protein